MGLLWNRESDAFLGIHNLKAQARNSIFQDLLSGGEVCEARVAGISEPLYFLADDLPLLVYILSDPPLKKRCECIAPLDCLLWDRKLIRALFQFDYKWEIYTPREQRKYGHYVLPILDGTRFVGRMEPVRENGTLVIRHVWLEPGVRRSVALESRIQSCAGRLARLNGVQAVQQKDLI